MTVKEPQSLPTLKNKRSRKFRPSATESFVIVKPPPTVSAHHPLNLQIQYIPSSSTDPTQGRRRTSSSSEKSGSESSNSTSSRLGKIVPLYNLVTHSHNLLCNSIHDAGTDEKLAKFQKAGVEIVNVGLFAPVEAWSTSSFDSEDVPSATKNPSAVEISASLPQAPNEPTRKLLGKLFQGKAPINPPEISPGPSLPDHHPEFALAPILGTTPTLLSRTVPPQGRAVAHTWICKRWHKAGDDWLSQAFHFPGHDKCPVDIRIEWARSSKRDIDAPSRKSSASNLQGAPDSPIPPVPSLPNSPVPEEIRGRPALNLTIPGSPMANRRKASGSSNGRTSDVEYDSDPEDSEVPWVCTVVIRASKSLALPSAAQEAPLRLKVASLAPAPHHPKVVAQLKMQYPLPDVDLLEAGLLQNRRLPGDPGSQPEGSSILTAEEIKDTVCATAMWVVVREGFSGVSKRGKRRLS